MNTLYYFGFRPEELDGRRKMVFNFIFRMLDPGALPQLVPIELDPSNRCLMELGHPVIFPADLNPSGVPPQHAATSFCIVYPGGGIIFTILG